jgi:hypothetical protein
MDGANFRKLVTIFYVSYRSPDSDPLIIYELDILFYKVDLREDAKPVSAVRDEIVMINVSVNFNASTLLICFIISGI